MAAELAKRVAGDTSGQDAISFIRAVYPLVTQRDPSETEIKAASDVIDKHGARAFCRALLNLNELIYID